MPENVIVHVVSEPKIFEREDFAVLPAPLQYRQTLEQATVYPAVSVSYRDMDASVLGFEKGCTLFVDFPTQIEMALRIPEARLLTGTKEV